MLKLFDNSGDNITIDMSASTSFIESASDADNATLTVAANITARGNIELTSTDGGFIKLTDGDLDNAGLAKLGLEGQVP